MDQKLNLLVLRCRDIEVSRVFYEHFGIVFEREQHGSGPVHYAAVFEGMVFELYPLKEGESADRSRLGFAVNLETDLRESLDAAGIEIVSSYEFDGRLIFVVQDPDGRKVELIQSEPKASEGDWTRFRSILLILAAIAGSLSFLNYQSEPMNGSSVLDVYFFYFALLVSLLFWPVMVVAVVGFQAINPYSDPVWTRPTHSCNPFRLKNPLCIAHFLMYFVMAQGAGALVTAILGGWLQSLMGIGMIIGGLEGLWALELVMKRFPEKMALHDDVDVAGNAPPE
ncbi:Glyoxalase-like domain protein [Gimesia maris]|uniref:VOC family protein n=1 Tax=Gimesia maris TaxID=122 RepID=UPI00118A9523|nr:VOC family protein [Gimesia maris]QDU14357.1 Glyoxalase-like domain protein [Gimesia maris]